MPAVAAAFDYAKPAVKATCSKIAETVTNAPELAAGAGIAAATALIGYKLMPKRRKYHTGTIRSNQTQVISLTKKILL